MILFHEKETFFFLWFLFTSHSVITSCVSLISEIEENSKSLENIECLNFSGTVIILFTFLLIHLLQFQPVICCYVLIYIIFLISQFQSSGTFSLISEVSSWNLIQYSVNFSIWYLASNSVPSELLSSLYPLYGIILSYMPILVQWTIYTINKNGFHVGPYILHSLIAILVSINTGAMFLYGKTTEYTITFIKKSSLCVMGVYICFIVRLSNSSYLSHVQDREFDKDKIEFAIGVAFGLLSRLLFQYSEPFIILILSNCLFAFCTILQSMPFSLTSVSNDHYFNNIKEYSFYLLIFPSIEIIYTQLHDNTFNKLICNLGAFSIGYIIHSGLKLLNDDSRSSLFITIDLTCFIVSCAFIAILKVYSRRSIELKRLICNNVHVV